MYLVSASGTMSPVSIIAVLFIIGVCLGSLVPLPFYLGLSLASGLIAVCALLPSRYRLVTGGAAAIALGWWATAPPLRFSEVEEFRICPRVVEGVVQAPADTNRDGQRLVLTLEQWSACLDGPVSDPVSLAWRPVQGRLFIRVDETKRLPFDRGDRIRLKARVKPFVPRRNPGSPRLRVDTPTYTAALTSTALMMRITAAPFPIRRPFDRLRRRFSRAYDRALPPRPAAMAKALSLGERDALSPEMTAHFRDCGVAHLLSVSGLHLGLSTLFAFILAQAVLRRTALAAQYDVGRIAAAVALPFAVAFALLTGLGTPVFRAMIMTVLALLGRILVRPLATVEALALAAVVVLATDPSSIWRPGFQLSFSAVLGFVVVFTLRRRHDEAAIEAKPVRHRIRRYFENLLISSVAATAATAPFVLYHFRVLPLIGVAANLIAIPLVGFLILPLLLTGMTLGFVFGTLFRFFVGLAAYPLRFLDGLLAKVSAFPLAIAYPGNVLGAGVSIMALGVLLLTARRKIAAGWCAAAGLAVILYAILVVDSPIPPGRMTVHFFDVGQGDSALLTTPGGDHLLIDAGGRGRGGFDAGREVVVPALRALGVSRLRALVLTHPDEDHVGGAATVIRNIAVDALWENGHGEFLGTDGGYREALAAARARAIPIKRTPGLCGSTRLGGITLSIVHPCDTVLGFDDARSTNDNAIVLSATFGDITAVFLGDIPGEVEEQLLAGGRLSRADILKVSHHGSHTATTDALLDTLAPGIAVISAAPYNRFGMPHPSVLDRLRRRRTRILRTDRMGAVIVTSDGRGIWIDTYGPR